jgi:hypothetical protein
MENVESKIIEHLEAIRADIGVIKGDLREAKSRLEHLEVGMQLCASSLVNSLTCPF